MTATEHFITTPEGPEPKGEALCLLCARAGTSCCRTEPELTYLSFPLSGPEWRRLLPFEPLATTATPDQAALFAAQERGAETAAAALADDPAVRVILDAALDPPPERAAGTRPGEVASAVGAAFPGDKDGSWPGDAVCAPEPNRPDFIATMRLLFPGHKERMQALFPPDGRHFALRTRADGSCIFQGSGGCRLPRPARPWYCLLFPAWMIEDSLTLFMSDYCLISQKARSPAHGAKLLDLPLPRIRELHRALCRDWGLAPHGKESL